MNWHAFPAATPAGHFNARFCAAFGMLISANLRPQALLITTRTNIKWRIKTAVYEYNNNNCTWFDWRCRWSHSLPLRAQA
jgi:hypothetical protein